MELLSGQSDNWIKWTVGHQLSTSQINVKVLITSNRAGVPTVILLSSDTTEQLDSDQRGGIISPLGVEHSPYL